MALIPAKKVPRGLRAGLQMLCSNRQSVRHGSAGNYKPKVYVTRPILPEALTILRKDCDVTAWQQKTPVPKDELLRHICDKDALFCLLSDKIDREVLKRANKLKVVGTMSPGFEHLPLYELKRRKIRIAHTPDVLTEATAELTVGLLLATSRRLVEAYQLAKTGGWTAWSPSWMEGPGLAGSTVGIVGFGRIGQAVAKILKSFNIARILFYNRSDRKKESRLLGADRVSLNELLALSDFVISAITLNPDTASMFNYAAFQKMKRNAIFINVSTGGVVDLDALHRALKNGVIRAAGIDVTSPEPMPVDHPLLKTQNCVISPHLGGATVEARKRMAILIAKNIVAGLKGDPMPTEHKL